MTKFTFRCKHSKQSLPPESFMTITLFLINVIFQVQMLYFTNLRKILSVVLNIVLKTQSQRNTVIGQRRTHIRCGEDDVSETDVRLNAGDIVLPFFISTWSDA